MLVFKMTAFRYFLLVCFVQEALSLIQVNPNMKTFSYAIKNGHLYANNEKTLYEHNTGQPGVITEQWFTGGGMDEGTTIKIYIDGEDEASLDFNLFIAHGIGFGEKNERANIPWGTRRIAHAADGGIYNTFRIPFGKSFRVTASRTAGSGYIWYIIRGVENYPLVLGDLLLPPTARLRLYKNIDVLLAPFDFLPLAFVKQSAGAVFMMTLVANSSDLVFLEGCMRAYIDDSNKTTWLSSGTEDFFLSAYYFNRGIYHQENAGLTFLDKSGKVAAYKFFENDPLLFSKSFQLWWRCSDLDVSKDPLGCPNTWPEPNPDGEDFRQSIKDGFHSQDMFASKENLSSKEKFSGKYKSGESLGLQPTTVTTYTWIYEW